MPLLLRTLARFVSLSSWGTPIMVAVLVFLTSWPLMAIVEPDGSELVRPENYWWYFVVTATTVGYGDLYPVTSAGHVVGGYVIVGGIATITTVFTKMVSVLERSRRQRMQGDISVDASDHIVLLGYTSGRTERIINLLAPVGDHIVLCGGEEVVTHPMSDSAVDFVSGDLASAEVLRRAGVHRARTVLVDARDDNEAVAVAVTAAHVTSGAHLVVSLRDMDRAVQLRYISDGIRCVHWNSPRIITEELKTTGISEVYVELMTPGGEAATHVAQLPESLGPVSVERCHTELGRRYGVTLLAARTGRDVTVNPNWQTELSAGSTIYYMSPRRLTTEQITKALSGGTLFPAIPS
ncbi:ion channel [Actinophytocola sp.]|uniref:ion channel n=1 Tax=Actinophytocola sp. TaxID=1872138 RepID=UPI003D6A7157